MYNNVTYQTEEFTQNAESTEIPWWFFLFVLLLQNHFLSNDQTLLDRKKNYVEKHTPK